MEIELKIPFPKGLRLTAVKINGSVLSQLMLPGVEANVVGSAYDAATDTFLFAVLGSDVPSDAPECKVEITINDGHRFDATAKLIPV